MNENEVPIEKEGTPKGLFRAIIKRIGLEKTLAGLKKKITFSEAGFSIATVLLVALVIILVQEINESGFFVYLSLFFSDSGFAVQHWSDLSLSTLESIPGLEITLSLLSLGVVLFAVRITAKYFDKISQITSKINKSLKYNGNK